MLDGQSASGQGRQQQQRRSADGQVQATVWCPLSSCSFQLRLCSTTANPAIARHHARPSSTFAPLSLLVDVCCQAAPSGQLRKYKYLHRTARHEAPSSVHSVCVFCCQAVAAPQHRKHRSELCQCPTTCQMLINACIPFHSVLVSAVKLFVRPSFASTAWSSANIHPNQSAAQPQPHKVPAMQHLTFPLCIRLCCQAVTSVQLHKHRSLTMPAASRSSSEHPGSTFTNQTYTIKARQKAVYTSAHLSTLYQCWLSGCSCAPAPQARQ
jgi:hypothetical protein